MTHASTTTQEPTVIRFGPGKYYGLIKPWLRWVYVVSGMILVIGGGLLFLFDAWFLSRLASSGHWDVAIFMVPMTIFLMAAAVWGLYLLRCQTEQGLKGLSFFIWAIVFMIFIGAEGPEMAEVYSDYDHTPQIAALIALVVCIFGHRMGIWFLIRKGFKDPAQISS